MNVNHGVIIENALIIAYQLGLDSPQDYWYMEIETMDGVKYKTKEDFYCSLKEIDNGKVIIGINGEAKTMYVHFPASSDCKTSLKLAR